MNRIEEKQKPTQALPIGGMLNSLCPEGVPMVKIGEYFTRIKGTPITATLMKDIANPDGDVKIFAGGKTIINAFEKDIPNANITRVPSVVVQSRGVIDVQYYDAPFTFKNEMWAYTHEDKTTVKYLYYVLKNSIEDLRQAGSIMGSMPQISLKVTENREIPLPPLSVQQEIVKILDSFTAYAAELQAELQARKQQYEYYRNQLLTHFKGDQPVKEYSLGELARVFDGTHQTPKYTDSGVPFVSVENIDNLYATKKYISEEAYKSYKNTPLANDIFMTRIGTLGKCAVVKDNRDLAYYVSLCLIRPDNSLILSKYLRHYIESNQGRKELLKRTLIDAVPQKINLGEVSKIKVIVPSLAEQSRIVSILDKFEALVNDLSAGLPSEIAAVQEQYEYYRNKLLTF